MIPKQEPGKDAECTNCGCCVLRDYRFCPECGEPINWPITPEQISNLATMIQKGRRMMPPGSCG